MGGAEALDRPDEQDTSSRLGMNLLDKLRLDGSEAQRHAMRTTAPRLRGTGEGDDVAQCLRQIPSTIDSVVPERAKLLPHPQLRRRPLGPERQMLGAVVGPELPREGQHRPAALEQHNHRIVGSAPVVRESDRTQSTRGRRRAGCRPIEGRVDEPTPPSTPLSKRRSRILASIARERGADPKTRRSAQRNRHRGTARACARGTCRARGGRSLPLPRRRGKRSRQPYGQPQPVGEAARLPVPVPTNS